MCSKDSNDGDYKIVNKSNIDTTNEDQENERRSAIEMSALKNQLEESNYSQVSLDAEMKWKPSEECFTVPEELHWFQSSPLQVDHMTLRSWLTIGEPNLEECRTTSRFCESTLQSQLLQAKYALENMEPERLRQVRSKANPFETIRKVCFLNRAALKMADIDAACNFMFTSIDEEKDCSERYKPYFFADVCAGPGGFTEYILWRKKWFYKGFGFTLTGKNDFKLNDFTAASPASFQTLYGTKGDGNIYDIENIRDFTEKVLAQTDNTGVHFMVSDGGFSVEGQEDLQEYLSKRLYLCQCLMALYIVREGGHFATKLFDTFTLFSVGLIFLMSQCFEHVTILKPNASRPANSERYLICRKRKSNEIVQHIRDHLYRVNDELHICSLSTEQDVCSIVPYEVIVADNQFFKNIMLINNNFCQRQINSLLKIIAFSENNELSEPRQSELRENCLRQWQVPDVPRVPPPAHYSPVHLINELKINIDFLKHCPIDVNENHEVFKTADQWNFCFIGENDIPRYNLYIACGRTRLYQLDLETGRWFLVNLYLELPRGTVLLGEVVSEVIFGSRPLYTTVPALHVIDAIRLGDVSLINMTHNQRRQLLQIFCEAINRPFHNVAVLRLKQVQKLLDVSNCDSPIEIAVSKRKVKLVHNLQPVCGVSRALFTSFILIFKNCTNIADWYMERYHVKLSYGYHPNGGLSWESLCTLVNSNRNAES